MKSLFNKRLSGAGVGVKAFIFLWATKLQVCHCCEYLCAVANGCVCAGVHTNSSVLCLFVSYDLCLSHCAQWQKRESYVQDKTVELNAFLVV